LEGARAFEVLVGWMGGWMEERTAGFTALSMGVHCFRETLKLTFLCRDKLIFLGVKYQFIFVHRKKNNMGKHQ
jgi:hypothetical protein